MREISLNDGLRALRKQIAVILLVPFLAGAGTAWLNVSVFEPTYTASASMYVLNRQSPGNMVSLVDLSSAGLLVADYTKLLRSDRVMLAAEEAIGLPLSDDSDYTISVGPDDQTRVIEIFVEGPDAEIAADIANSLASNLSRVVIEVMKVENIAQVDSALPPTEASGPRTLLNTALAGTAALFMTVFLILAWELFSSTIDNSIDVHKSLALPVLAKLPKLRRRRLRRRGNIVQSYYNAPMGVHNAVKILRSNIEFAADERAVKTIVISSAKKGEGKTTTAIFLAIAMAESGKRTLIINTDSYYSSMSALFGRRAELNWFDLIQGEASVNDVIMPTDQPNLYFIEASPDTANPVEQIGSERFEKMIQTLKPYADVIIFDTPPLGGFIEAALLGKRADAALLVIRAGRTPANMAKDVIQQYNNAGARLLGIVMTGVEPVSEFSDYYRYQTLGQRLNRRT